MAGSPSDYLVVGDPSNWITQGVELLYVREKPTKSGYCALCGIWREVLHRDHIIPKFKGGTDHPRNIQMICANCHQEKCAAEARDADYLKRRAPLSDELRRRLGHANEGRARPEQAERMRGRTQSAESNAKRSQSLKGRVFSALEKAVVSEGLRRSWVRRKAGH